MKTCFSILLSLFGVVLTVTVVIGSTILSAANPSFYKQLLEKDNFYSFVVNDALPVLISEGVKESKQVQEKDTSNIYFGDKEISSIIARSITEDWVRKSAEKLLDEYTKFLDYKTDSPDLTIDFAPVLANLSANVTESMVTEYNALKVCSSSETSKILKDGVDGFPTCRVEGYSLEQLAQKIGVKGSISDAVLKDAKQNFPEKYDILNPPKDGTNQTEPETQDNLAKLKSQRDFLKLARSILTIAIIFDILIFILLFLIHFRYLRSALRWPGVNIFISGTILLVIFLAGALITNLAISTLPNSIENVPDVITDKIYNILRSFFNVISSKIGIQSAILMFAGFAMFIVSFFFKKKSVTPAPQIR